MLINNRELYLAWRFLNWSLIVCFSLVLGFGLAFFLHGVVLRYPRIAYDSERPSTIAECGRVKQGMSLPAALSAINPKSPPFVQRITGSQLIFMRSDGMCVVDFDPAARQVVKAHIQPPENTIWLE